MAKAIQELAGHSGLGTTLRYMQLSPGAKDAAIRVLDAQPEGRGTPVAPAAGIAQDTSKT